METSKYFSLIIRELLEINRLKYSVLFDEKQLEELNLLSISSIIVENSVVYITFKTVYENELKIIQENITEYPVIVEGNSTVPIFVGIGSYLYGYTEDLMSSKNLAINDFFTQFFIKIRELHQKKLI